MYYIWIGIAFNISSFIEIFSNINRKLVKIFFYLLSICMLFLVGFRNGMVVGTDSPAYYQFYLEKFPHVEVGYKYVNAFFSTLEIPYNIFLFIINLLIINNLRIFIQKNCHYLILPLFIYYSDFFFYYNFSGIRQAIAMSFTALSIHHIFQGKKFIPTLLILIASTFHISAFIFLIIFFLPKDKLSFLKYVKLMISISLAILIANYFIQNNPILNKKFLYYYSLQEHSENILINYYIGLMKRLFVVLGLLIISKKRFFFNNKNFFLLNIYLIGLMIYTTSYLISPDFGVRFGSYFIIVDCILISRYLSTTILIGNRLIILLAFSSMALYKIYTYTLLISYNYQFASF